MKQEFEERANLKVSLGCYHSLIEPGYNASKLDKDEWVKEWKKNGGVQAAYDWERTNRQLAEKSAKHTQEILDSVVEERDFYINQAKEFCDRKEELDKENETLKSQVDALNNEAKSIAEFMVKRGTKNNDLALLHEAATILGEKAYIEYKLKNNIELNEEDKKIIIRNLK